MNQHKLNGIIRGIHYATKTNELIFWLKRIPIIKRFVSPYVYENPRHKRFYAIFSFILIWIRFLFRQLLITGALSLGATFISSNTEFMQNIGTLLGLTFTGQSVYFMLVLIYTMVSTNSRTLFDDNWLKWVIIEQFRGNHLGYYRYALSEKGIELLVKGGIMAGGSLLFGKTMITGLIFLMFVLTYLTYEGLSLRNFRLKEKPRGFWRSFRDFGLIIGLFGVVLFVSKSMSIFWSILLLMYVVGVLNFYAEYRRLNEDVVFKINRYQKSSLKLSSEKNRELIELQKEQSRIDDNVDVTSGLEIVKKRQGFSMLNALFYTRHKRLWQKRLVTTLKGFVIVGTSALLILIGFRIISPHEFSDLFGTSHLKPLSFFKILVFIIGISNFTESIVNAYFLNCDMSLLHYGFYRRKEVIWKQYASRIWMMVFLNLLPVFVICVYLGLFAVIGIYSFNADLLWLMVNIVLISAFISVYNLTLYYLIQPYNMSMEMKSPLYGFTNGVLYVMLFQLPTEVFDFLAHNSALLALALLVFVGLATASVYLFGEKTYKLRKG